MLHERAVLPAGTAHGMSHTQHPRQGGDPKPGSGLWNNKQFLSLQAYGVTRFAVTTVRQRLAQYAALLKITHSQRGGDNGVQRADEARGDMPHITFKIRVSGLM